MTGALVVATRRGGLTNRLVRAATAGLARCMGAATLAPSIARECIAHAAAGLAGMAVAAACSARLQVFSPAIRRGGIMAAWTLAVVGTRPDGALIVGAVSDHVGAQYALGLGVASCVTGLVLWEWIGRRAQVDVPAGTNIGSSISDLDPRGGFDAVP